MPKKQSDGRYRAKITIGHTADGKAITKYVSGKTKRELEDAKSEARAYYIDGTALLGDKLFREYAKDWYRIRKEPGLSQSSKAGYLNYLNNHILPTFGDRMLRAIQALEMQEWINQYAGRSNTFVSMLVATMKAIMSSACAEGYIPRDPSIALKRPPIKKADERRAFTKEEQKRIEKVIGASEHGMLLAVLYYLGVRRGEALGLEWGDFDWKEKTVHIQRDIDYSGGNKGVQGALKTPAADRRIPVPPPLFAMLQGLRGLSHVLLFSNGDNQPLSYVTFKRWWMRLMVECGFAIKAERGTGEKASDDLRLDWKCDITPHYFRHNYITMLYTAGIDPLIAMRLVGHEDYKTTAQIYTHLNNMHLEKASRKLDKMFGVKKVAEKLPEVF